MALTIQMPAWAMGAVPGIEPSALTELLQGAPELLTLDEIPGNVLAIGLRDITASTQQWLMVVGPVLGITDGEIGRHVGRIGCRNVELQEDSRQIKREPRGTSGQRLSR